MGKIKDTHMIDHCSACEEEACECEIVLVDGSKHLVRDCQPRTYEELPAEVKEEMYG